MYKAAKMTLTSLRRLFVIVLAFASLSACKVIIELPAGGIVQSSSGNFDCRGKVSIEQFSFEPTTRSLHSGVSSLQPAHDDAFHCEFDVSDTSFDEVFTAIPDAGYKFSHWRKRDRGFFGDSTKNGVRLFTSFYEGNDVLLQLLASNEIFYMEPVFKRIGGDSVCDQYNGSFERIQDIVFNGYNCTNSACHGAGASAGGLDLSPSVAYQNLFRVTASANLTDPLQLVFPGEQKNSFLFLKLNAATNGTSLPTGGGLAMPLGRQGLTANHLEAMRLWIRGGAPETTDVDGVATLLGCDTATSPTANKIAPPDAPAIGEGIQFPSGAWPVLPGTENEVCYATYYDLKKTPEYLPQWAETACAGSVYSDYDGSCMATNARTLTQDPQSHHSIIDVYVGDTSPLDPSWGEWQCLNGPFKGASCDPTRIGVPVSEGGADCGDSLQVCGTVPVKSIACRGWGPGDRAYKSVGMGGAQSPISSNTAVPGVYSVLPSKGVITWNSHAFNLSAKATTISQYNNFMFAPQDGRQFRSRGIFDAKDIFIANVPPYQRRTYCSTYTLPKGARLTQLGSHAHKRGVLWQTWLPPQDSSCTARNGCKPNATTPDYVSRIYNDPLYLDYDPPLEFDFTDSTQRTMKFCVTYDNGDEFPDLLKRNSTSVGTKCVSNAYCAGGAFAGTFCGADDGLCGDGGSCDACPVRGGVTTEDEMFLLLGSFYVVP